MGEPSLTEDEELLQLAKGLQQRFIVRRIIAEPEVESAKGGDNGATAPKKPNAQAIELAVAEATTLQAAAAEKKMEAALKTQASETGCLAMLSAWLCDSKSVK